MNATTYGLDVAKRIFQMYWVDAQTGEIAKRGYGDSSKPDGGPNHVNYSKRLMGLDQVEVMRALGFKRFQAVGHDRGARVLHGMLIHYPQAVQRAVMLDIAPADQMYAHTDESFATRYFWWFFHIQPASAAGADDRGRA